MTNDDDQDLRMSIIIPTIWKCPDNLVALCDRLRESSFCGQVLIIDNDGTDNEYDEIRGELKGCGATIVSLPYNVYVNAAWNIGICMAKCSKFLLLNDDVQIYSSCLSDMAHVLDANSNVGLVGFAVECVFTSPVPHEQSEDPTWRVVPDLVTNYGCCMAGRTEHYEMIPRTLKVFSGDNWLFYRSRAAGRANVAITNKHIQHLLASSSREYPEMARTDWEEFQRLWHAPK